VGVSKVGHVPVKKAKILLSFFYSVQEGIPKYRLKFRHYFEKVLKDSITGNHLPYFNGRQKIDFHQKKEEKGKARHQ
jgi:hypothetical protein